MLDPAARLGFARTLQELRGTQPLGILQITHHLEEVEHADRAVVLIDGHVAAEGAPSDVFWLFAAEGVARR